MGFSKINMGVIQKDYTIISVSVVLYKNSPDELNKLKKSLALIKVRHKIIIIDNSPSDVLREFFGEYNVEYIFNPSNPGFGAGHNIAIEKSVILGCKYHLILNPDIYFNDGIIEELINVMLNNPNIGMIMPKILNLDGSIQNLPKLLPSPFSILMRKIKLLDYLYKSFANRYELRFVPEAFVYNTPILSGCFSLINLNAIKKVGMYDDKFFMYFEDWDLSRRIHEHYATIYYPKVSVFHGYYSGANKSFKLLIIFLKSAIYYFNKWGWIFDEKRDRFNKETLAQF